jgi:hypothetical protein
MSKMQYTRHKIPKNSHPLLWDEAAFTQLWFCHSNDEIRQMLSVGHNAIQRAIKRFGLTGRVYQNAYIRSVDGVKRYIREPSRILQNGKRREWYDGYIRIYIDGKWIPEHRIIMEKYLTRKLLKSETIHHINGNKVDNRIENLQILSRSDHHIRTQICCNCPLKKENRLLRVQVTELAQQLQGKFLPT